MRKIDRRKRSMGTNETEVQEMALQSQQERQETPSTAPQQQQSSLIDLKPWEDPLDEAIKRTEEEARS